MTIELFMPKIGLTMTEGRLDKWLKKIGDQVAKGDVVFVGETEKSTFDFESPGSGVLEKIIVAEDETVPVGTVVGLLADDGVVVAAAPPAPGASPRASAQPEGRLVPLTGMRRTIAERMAVSRREAAQTEMVAHLDATALLARKTADVTITDLVLHATAAAVGRHPEMNTRFTADGIFYPDAIHLGVAMALDDGLIVPVIRDAGTRSLADISAERARLVAAGKKGALGPDDLKGSTITVSSLGMLGVEAFTAILNPPEAAILAIGAIGDRPVAVAKQVVVRPMMTVTLSYDHRTIDGATAARFLQTLRQIIEGRA